MKMQQAAILGTGTAVPETRYEQESILERLIVPTLGRSERARRIFRHSGIETRHSVLPDLAWHETIRSTGERNALWIERAVPLLVTAVRRCLEEADCPADRIDEVVTVSCTGIDTPGLDLRLAADLPLRSDAKRIHLGGMGCYASLPALYRAAVSVDSGAARRVLVASVELCTLHYQHQPSAENLVVSSLFSDGAAAALVGRSDDPSAGLRLRHFATWTDPRYLDRMGFHLTDHGFRMNLSADVPALVETLARQAAPALLDGAGVRREEIGAWLIHPGGVRILEAVERALELPENALDLSRSILARYGNLSSATSLFLLDEHRRRHRGRGPARESGEPGEPGEAHAALATGPRATKGLLLALGPGLTVEGAIFED